MTAGTAQYELESDVVHDVDRLGPSRALARLRERLGLTDLPTLDLEALARPVADQEFASPREFHAAVRTWIDDDLAAAAQGNADGPLKAALDVIRDVRGVLREAVDFGGLSAESHEDFLGWFGPLSSFLSAGPPMIRLAQTRAVMDAGVLHLTGPDSRFETGPDGFVVRSPQVAGSATGPGGRTRPARRRRPSPPDGAQSGARAGAARPRGWWTRRDATASFGDLHREPSAHPHREDQPSGSPPFGGVRRIEPHITERVADRTEPRTSA